MLKRKLMEDGVKFKHTNLDSNIENSTANPCFVEQKIFQWQEGNFIAGH